MMDDGTEALVLVDRAICAEWAAQHALGREALAWIVAHADAGDDHPIATAVALLRAGTVLEPQPRDTA